MRVAATVSTDLFVIRTRRCSGNCGWAFAATEPLVTSDTASTGVNGLTHDSALTGARAPEGKPASVPEESILPEKKPLTPFSSASLSGFDEFWSAYPRKTGKGAARRAWMRSKPPLSACLFAIRWQLRDKAWLKDGGAFIPHPSTWINSERWLDEQPAAPRAPDTAKYHAPVKEPSWMGAFREERKEVD